MKIQMKECYRFCRRQHKIKTVVGRLRDGRKKPPIKPGTIFLLMVLMVAWGKRQFLEMDQFARRRAGSGSGCRAR